LSAQVRRVEHRSEELSLPVDQVRKKNLGTYLFFGLIFCGEFLGVDLDKVSTVDLLHFVLEVSINNVILQSSKLL